MTSVELGSSTGTENLPALTMDSPETAQSPNHCPHCGKGLGDTPLGELRSHIRKTIRRFETEIKKAPAETHLLGPEWVERFTTERQRSIRRWSSWLEALEKFKQ